MPILRGADAQESLVEGVIECGRGFVAKQTCLGRTFKTQISGREVSLDLPVWIDPPEGSDRWPEIRPPRWTYLPASAGWEQSFQAAIEDWGSPTKGHLGDGTGEAVVAKLRFACFFPSAADGLRDAFDTFSDELQTFWPKVGAWIEVLTGQDLEVGGTQISAPFVPSAWHVEDRHIRHLQRNHLPRVVNILTSEAIDPETFDDILGAVARGVEPPLARQLLVSARYALREGHWRRCVIDAGTSAELSITSIIESHSQSAGSRILSALLDSHRSLGGRLKLLRILSPEALPAGDLDKLLVNPRNVAAHSGAQPSREEAVGAVRVAGEFAESAFPKGELLPGGILEAL